VGLYDLASSSDGSFQMQCYQIPWGKSRSASAFGGIAMKIDGTTVTVVGHTVSVNGKKITADEASIGLKFFGAGEVDIQPAGKCVSIRISKHAPKSGEYVNMRVSMLASQAGTSGICGSPRGRTQLPCDKSLFSKAETETLCKLAKLKDCTCRPKVPVPYTDTADACKKANIPLTAAESKCAKLKSKPAFYKGCILDYCASDGDPEIVEDAEKECEQQEKDCDAQYPEQAEVCRKFQEDPTNKVLLFGWKRGCRCTTIAQKRFEENGVCWKGKIWNEPDSDLMAYLQCKEGNDDKSFIYVRTADGWDCVGNGYDIADSAMPKERFDSLVKGSCDNGEDPTPAPTPAPPPARCSNPDKAHGGKDSRTRWASSSVNAPAKCQSQTQTRTCNDGTFSAWSGTYTKTACSVKAPTPPPTVCERDFPEQAAVLTKFQNDLNNRVLLFGWTGLKGCYCTTVAMKRLKNNGVCYEGSMWDNADSELMAYLRCKEGTKDKSFVYFRSANGWNFIGNGFALGETKMTKDRFNDLCKTANAKTNCK